VLDVSLKPMTRGPVSIVVSSWKPPDPRFDTTAASSAGKAAELIQALIVMLPVSRSGVGLPRLTTSSSPASATAFPYLPPAHPAPLARVPVMPLADASVAVVPALASKA
jgi:hypothetical protein